MRRPRIHYTESQKALMWERWSKGDTLHQIGKLFDRPHTSIVKILGASGGIRPAERHRCARALSMSEREEISRALSLPSAERYSTHLEWHAMFCVIGELLTREPLVKVAAGDYGSLEYFMASHRLTESPLWLSDFRQSKPLEYYLWQEEIDGSCTDSEWMSDVDEARMLDYLIPGGKADVPVSAREHGAHGERRWSIDVSSALVSPETAPALLRALQGAETSWDYALPGTGHTGDIDSSPFVLRQWISERSRDVELDQDDALRREVRAREALPGKRMREWLSLPVECDEEMRWRSVNGRYSCAYLAWSDPMVAVDRSMAAQGCTGYRLVLNKEGLREVLRRSGMDLLVEITFKRRIKEYAIADDDQEEASEREFDFLVVLSRDGTVESARGAVGVWYAPGSGAGAE